ncbi:MAG: heme exporter protein CcmD [Pseudomonadota bacterium]
MDWSAPHIGFVLASYGISAAVLGGLIVAVIVQNRLARRKLDELEGRQAARRRSANEVEAT